MTFQPEVFCYGAWRQPVQARKREYATQGAAARVLWLASREAQAGIIEGQRIAVRQYRGARPDYINVRVAP